MDMKKKDKIRINLKKAEERYSKGDRSALISVRHFKSLLKKNSSEKL